MLDAVHDAHNSPTTSQPSTAAPSPAHIASTDAADAGPEPMRSGDGVPPPPARQADPPESPRFMCPTPDDDDDAPLMPDDVDPALFDCKLLGGAFSLAPCLEFRTGMDIRSTETGETVGYVNLALLEVKLSILDEYANGRPVRSWLTAVEYGMFPRVFVYSVSATGSASRVRVFAHRRGSICGVFFVPMASALRVVVECACSYVLVADLAWSDTPEDSHREFRCPTFMLGRDLSSFYPRSASFPSRARVDRTWGTDGEGAGEVRITASACLEVDRVGRAVDAFISEQSH
jgi:hypothetical protein